MKGICPVCQGVQEIEFSPVPRQQEEARGLEWEDIEMTYGDDINYVVVPHVFYGVDCEGSGQIPQGIIKD